MDDGRVYICIDLKTFYASVECAERGLDPFTTNLVVADPDRTDKTICLAVSPAMKALGVRNRCRVFEIPKGIDYIMAKPRMKLYMQRSVDVYCIYLRYIAPEDIHVYSVDECFIDATPYLSLYDTDAYGLAKMLMDAVYSDTCITATAGVGTNLFLAKVALDVLAKHEEDGVAYLDQSLFKLRMWHHRPITDVWNIGPGIARRLEEYGVYDLAGLAAMKKETLFREFGVNAEFLIDHANGVEPCTMAQIKAYKPDSHGLSNGQALPCDYTKEEARLVLREMVDELVLELVEKRLVAGGVSLSVGYAKAAGEEAAEEGRVARGRWGPSASAQRKLSGRTASFRKIWPAFEGLFDGIVEESLPVRRINIALDGVVGEEFEELDLFADEEADEAERREQEAILAVKQRFGKNALFKASSLCEKATARERNEQVGGHHA